MVNKKQQRATSDNEIQAYTHCVMCVDDWKAGRAPGQSMETYARLNVGFTPLGLQVWCVRHDVNVTNIDFEGQKHPANTGRSVKGAKPS